MEWNAKTLAELILSYRFRWHNEEVLQAALADTLWWHGVNFTREHRLPKGAGTIDFLVGQSVGVEVKISGSRRLVLRQLQRYAPHVEELLLVTGRVQLGAMPNHLLPTSTPLEVVTLEASFL